MSGLTYPEVEKAIYNKRGQMLIRDKKSDQLLHRFILGATVLAVLSLITIEIQWLKLLSRTDEFFLVLLRLIATSLTPHAWLELPTLWVPLFESLSVTVLATFYSAIIGLFIGALAAPNINQNRWLTMGIHMFFTFLRAVPTPVWRGKVKFWRVMRANIGIARFRTWKRCPTACCSPPPGTIPPVPPWAWA